MIEATNLGFSYSKKSPVFSDLTVKLPSGHIYGLLGKNGSGKSTLLKLITGLLFPDNGDLKVLAFSPRSRDPLFLQEIFIITEEFDLPGIRIGTYEKLYSSFYPRFNREQFREYITSFGLSFDQVLTELSYGQKKCFLISFGLATDSRLLILDEPTNGLDIPSKSRFRKIVANAIHEDRTFIISTHQVRDIENLIDPVVILDEGKVIFFESCESISSRLSITRETVVDEDAIYYESYLGGYTVVSENLSGDETHMNLEIVFNAIVNNPARINGIFNIRKNAGEVL